MAENVLNEDYLLSIFLDQSRQLRSSNTLFAPARPPEVYRIPKGLALWRVQGSALASPEEATRQQKSPRQGRRRHSVHNLWK